MKLRTFLLWCRLIGTLARWTFRFLSGRPMDGKFRTDATFLRPGSRDLTVRKRASRWAYLPGWQVAAYRLVVPVVAVAGVWAYLTAPTLTTIGGTGSALVTGGRKVIAGWRNRKYVTPTARTLAPMLNQDPTRRDWLHIPNAMLTDGRTLADRVFLPAWWPVRKRGRRTSTEGWVRFPADLEAGESLRGRVADILAMKLGTRDLITTWHGVGAAPELRFRPRPRPPVLVTFADLLPAIAKAPESAPIIGASASGPYAIDLDTDAPHCGASCGSGAGKSKTLMGLIAQWLHHGVQVVILDNKRVSQSWCKDLPGVRYCRTGEQLHHALIELAEEVDRRFDLIDAVPADQEDTVDVGPRIVVVFEEQNIGMAALKQYWDEIRQPGDPKRSPAMVALDKVLCAGRQCRIHVFSVAQMFTVQSTGGNPAARENYGVRILARATRNAWQMLAPECGPQFPKSSKRRGRMHVVLAGEATEVQVCLWTVDEARKWATSGDVTVPATWNTTSDLRDSTVTVTSGRYFTLPEAANEPWCTKKYDALRQDKRRGKLPAGREIGGQTKWTKDELLTVLGTKETSNGTH